MSEIFKIIKSIQKIDRKILPHAEKNLLISIAIHLGEKGHIWPSNEQMGERIGESKDYVKNLLMRLKNKRFIKIEGRGKSRKIYIVTKTIFGNSQLPNHANGNSQLPTGNSQLPKAATPIKRKEKKILKEKMLPQGISFDSFFDNLPEGIAGKIQRKTVKDFWDKGFEDDLIGLTKSLASSPLDERILIFQGTLKIFDRKLQMKNEQIAIDESNAHKLDFVAAPDRLTGLSSVVGQSI